MTIWLISYAAGWLITLSPCVLPILPLLLSGAANRHKLAPLIMACGLVLAFALLGTFIGLIGDQLNLSSNTLRQLSALLLLGAAAFVLLPTAGTKLGQLFAPLANRANLVSNKLDGLGPAGAFLTGALLGAVWAPCSGPALVAAIGLAADAQSAGEGFARLLVFGLGAATPLVLIAYGARGLLLGWLKANTTRIKRGFGIFLALIGLLILTGLDTQLQEAVLGLLPQRWLLTVTQL